MGSYKWVVAILLSYAAVLPGQTPVSPFRIRILTTDGTPVHGALIALIDSANRVVAEGISSESGTRTLSASAGAYRIRVRRIGFQPFLSDRIALPYNGVLPLRIESRRVSLQTVVVSGSGECRQPAADAGVLSTVWTEISKALEASRLTLDDLTGVGHGRVYTRHVGTQGEILFNESREFPIANRRPFSSVDPAVLARKGYVTGDEYKGWDFFGPDESVLLSRDFARTHCFTVVRDSTRHDQIGVGFHPMPKRRVPDIDGVLWVDVPSSELREMIFRYVNAGLPAGFTGDGFTRFRRLQSGSWIVDEWKLTMPLMGRRPRSLDRPNRIEIITKIGTVETGGSIVVPSEGHDEIH